MLQCIKWNSLHGGLQCIDEAISLVLLECEIQGLDLDPKRDFLGACLPLISELEPRNILLSRRS